MTQTNAMDDTGATTGISSNSVDNNPVRLYNDVHFRPVPACDYWPLFPLLLPELRLRVWELFLQRYRMIELDICVDEDEDNDDDDLRSRYYTERNYLGNIISGGNYSLSIEGRGYALPSPLLWVNSEARYAALKFSRVRLPFPRRNGERVLYLSPEYDVLYVWPMPEPEPRPEPRAIVLVDFLHDVKAYDHKDQGHSNYDSPSLVPAILHPTAASSFAGILRRLRSVLCVVGFRDCMRAASDQMMWPHFAQTFPLRRRGSPTGAFDWLESDPRLGVQLDLRLVALDGDPRCVARAWDKLEKAFGVERAVAKPTEAGVQPPPEGSREELAEHLHREAEHWDYMRTFYSTSILEIQRHGMIDAEMYGRMERLPSTAVGMWLFSADAFEEPQDIARFRWDLSAVRPGLLLFEY
ncbi:hypothetical protein VM1G_06042 [Cytospora mali]|uniref:2EXR domain-containing protein n=1 Tax=Cytospora mali TaxID=578113 RepID=A0A194W378_CYTMA|nr:hypothetical protein VM1G_06042 [Valsa mali]